MKTTFLLLAALILLVLPTTLSLFGNDFYSTHDGVTHVVRFSRFYKDLQEGQILPRWIENVSFGLGSPVLIFNSLLPYYLAAIPKILGFSFAESIKIIFGLSMIASAVTFFIFAKEIFPKKSAFLGSLVFAWAPYRFVDIYVRGAFPEAVSFIFIPLVMLAAHKIIVSSDRRIVVWGAISLALLILCHNVMFLLFGGVYIVYGVALAIFLKKKDKIILILLSVLLSLSISAFFWMPAFLQKGATNLDYLNQTKSFTTNFVSLSGVIYSKWGWGPLDSTSPMSLQLGVVQWLAVILAVILLIFSLIKKYSSWKISSAISKNLKIENLDYFHLCLFLFLFGVAVFLMTSYSILLWQKISLLSFFLYPWRFLILAIFASAIFMAIVVKQLKFSWLFILFFVVLLFYANRNDSQLVGKVTGQDSFYLSYNDTTDMWGEFLPNTVNLSTIKKCKETQDCQFSKLIVPKDVLVTKLVQSHDATIFSYQSKNTFLGNLNTFYFPGWNVYIDHQQWKNYQINTLGTLDVNFPLGQHEVELKFEDTPLMKTSLYVSFLGIILTVFSFLWINGLKLKFLKTRIGS